MRLSPEILYLRRAFDLDITGVVSYHCMAWWFGPAGVGEHGVGTSGFPRNLGRPALSTAPCPDGDRIVNPRPANYAIWIGGSEAQAHVAVRSRERQGSVPEGARESERLIVPVKPANTTRVEPVEGRRRRVAESLEGNMASALELDPMSTKQQRIAELGADICPQRSRNLTSRMRELRTSGSVGGGGGNSAAEPAVFLARNGHGHRYDTSPRCKTCRTMRGNAILCSFVR